MRARHAHESNLFPQLSHTDFTKRTRSSVYIYTYTRSYILLSLSFHRGTKIRTRLNVSFESAFPDLHFDKRRAAEGQTRQIF